MKFVAPEVRTIQKELASKVGTVVRTSKAKATGPAIDPTEVALRLGWVERYPGRGQWYYMPQYATLQTCLKEIVLERVTKKQGFVEVIWPKILPLDIAFTAKKIQGEPGGMFYVCPPRVREKQEYVPLQVLSEITRELPMKELKELLEDPGYVLDPAQCPPFYQLLRNKTLRKDDLPIKVYDYGGPTYRYEAGGVRGLERLSEFWRIEHVWLGTPEQVEAIRKELMEEAIDALERTLKLEWRIQYAGDTFYLAEDQKIDEGVDVPEAPKYEWQFYLPFKGSRDSNAKDVWLACGSFNSHGNHYTKNFGIKCTTGEDLWTGCFGVGTTRLTAAFLAQKGFDFDAWPEPVKRRVRSLPSIPKPV
jgi:seryl-tRNA synthetase